MLRTLTVVAALLAAAPALGQQADPPPLPDPNDQSDTFTIGAGVGYVPDYEGSDNYRIIPAAAIRGQVSGISFFTRATYLYVDLVGRGDGPVELDVGPIVGVRLNRTGKIKDDIVDLLPERKAAIEAGGFVGISLHNLTNPYDTLQLRLDVLRDFANAHESTLFSPNLSFSTPLSRKTYASASIGADFVSDRFADYYFGITPAEALATGGPLAGPRIASFDADGGMKSWKASLLLNQSMTGDLTGGWSVFGMANYSRLVGDFKRSPIVSERGSSSQWLAALGVAYTF